MTTMSRFTARKTFRVDEATSLLLTEIARHSFRCESELLRKYVVEGARREAEVYVDETQKVLETLTTLKRV